MTFAEGDESCFRLSSERCALTCWIVPKTAFIMRTRNITIVLSILPENIEISAAISSITIKRSQNWLKNTFIMLSGFCSSSTFSPFSSRSCLARLLLSPSGPEPSSLIISADARDQ